MAMQWAVHSPTPGSSRSRRTTSSRPGPLSIVSSLLATFSARAVARALLERESEGRIAASAMMRAEAST
jgi:hypothetical protein